MAQQKMDWPLYPSSKQSHEDQEDSRGHAEALIFKSSDHDDLTTTTTTTTTLSIHDIFHNFSTLFPYSPSDENMSEYMSGNDTMWEETEPSVVPVVLKGIVLISIILLAIFSNLLVVISVVRCHKLRHINNYFLVSLAVADLLVAVFAMSFNATVELTGKWNFGYRICDLWNSLDTHFCTVSTLHLCCIAVDRYYAIVRPLKYTSYMTVKVAACMIGVAWTAPTLISFLPIFFGWYTTSEHQEWRKTHPNECIFRVNQPYAFISSTLTFWAPVFVMLVIYRRIYKEALRQKEAIRRSSVPSQQHLLVDTDSAKSRFQELQANGFRTGNGLKKKKKRESRRFGLKHNKDESNGGSRRSNSLPGGVVIAKRLSPTDSDPLQSSTSTTTTTTTTMTSQILKPVVPILIMSTASSENVQDEPGPPANSEEGSEAENETVPLRTGECETRFGGGNPVPGGPEVTFLAPFQRISGLTPAAAGFVGTIQRRLSTANSSLSEGLRERHRIHTSWRKEHKAFVTLGIVMGAFLLCWLPFFTWYLTVAICGDTYCPCPDVVVSILFWIGYFNSTLNPVIYVMTNRDFKDAFTDILRKIFCCCCPNKGCAGGSSGAGAEYHSTNVDYV